MSIAILQPQSLPPETERQLIGQHEADLAELLPTLGPAFGIGMVFFSLWDYVIDPQHAPLTALVRVAFVLLGSVAYIPNRLKWSTTLRCGYIYWAYSCAIIICEFLLKDGFRHGLAGVTACIFTISVMTLRARTFFLMLSVPALLLVVLTAIRLPMIEFANVLMLFIFCTCLAYVLMLAMRFFRQRAFMLQAELTDLSRHDSLTGVYRRGYLTELAEREMATALRRNRSLAVAMLDIDHFKLVNDNYGHGIGDEVIRRLAKTCLAELRDIDHFGRIGGEEFVCVLPEATADEAMVCAERLRQQVEKLRVETPKGPLQFTVSIGVSVLDPSHAGWNQLLKDADMALYRAKNAGRNRVMLASPPSG